MVSSTIKLFDGPVLQIFISCFFNNDTKQNVKSLLNKCSIDSIDL